LLPANACKKVVGKEIARKDAALELTISIRSFEQADFPADSKKEGPPTNWR
jgi:hypothetical protein